MTDTQYKELTDRLEQTRQDKEQAAGAHKQLMRDLRKEFGVKTLREAKNKLAAMQKRQAELEAEAEEKYNELMKQLPDED